MGQQILVTGGAGFIGSHLCARLIADGHDVVCVDNFFTGRAENVAALHASGRFILREQDICTPFDDSLGDGNIDAIYNLACPASPVHYQFDPVRTVRTNVLGTINVLDLAKRRGARLLQASTSEVYGDPDVHPQPETYRGNVNPIGPRACYDEGKRCAETLCFDYRRQFGLSIKIARIFNTYGPRMHPNDGRVVSNFIVQSLRGEAITIYGDGLQTRAFCYVDDLVDGLMRLMDSPDAFTGPVNLGNPHEVSIGSLAETIVGLTKAGGKLVYKDLPIDDPVQRCPDISLAQKMLDWRPSVQLEDGLRRTVDYFAAELNPLR